MSFSLFISTESDAFQSGDSDLEISRILLKLAADVASNGPLAIQRLFDANGNRVGFATTLEIADVADY
jgi:hypothetical protein